MKDQSITHGFFFNFAARLGVRQAVECQVNRLFYCKVLLKLAQHSSLLGLFCRRLNTGIEPFMDLFRLSVIELLGLDLALQFSN